jgi:arsenate reductase
MAEAFANRYGVDVLRALSAGLAPAQRVPPNTVRAMSEMDIDVSNHVPRLYNPLDAAFNYDIVVNMSGYKLPGLPPKDVIEWEVNDPYGFPMDTYRMARNDLEQLVMRLILDLRRRTKR